MPRVRSSLSASTEQLLDSAPDGVVIIDSRGRIRLVNRQAEALFGYHREELMGQDVEVLVPDRVRARHPRHRMGYFHDPATRPMGGGLELTARRKDGTEFPVDISLSSLETPDGVLVSAAVRDITDRKRIEAQFQGLLEAAPDAIVAVDESGLIRLLNRQAELMFGYDRQDLVGRPLERLIPERFRERHPAHRASYVARPLARPMGAGLELAARRKDGTEFEVDISLSSLEGPDGVLVTAAVRDITDRKRAEEEQSRLEAQLQQAQRDEERAQLEAQLHQAQRLESVGQLAGGIAHDFNNLLAGIMNYAALVTDGLEQLMSRPGLAVDEEVAALLHDVAEINNVAGRAATLTHQLLIFSRRERIKPEVLDLNGVVVDLEKLLRRTLGEQIELSTGLAPDLPRTRADRGQLEQVLMNLAVNARAAMPTGGRLRIETSLFQGGEQVDGPASRRQLCLLVTDTGVGMAPHVVERAFEPFFTTKPKGEGTGLGLATVYGIVAQAGGSVSVESTPGAGTTFRVLLPVTDDSAVQPSRGPEPEPRRRGGETILLVEDEEMVRVPAERILARHGYTVLTASRADEALTVARGHDGAVDLLLTDVVMPGRPGPELAEEFLLDRPGCKVLFMSGYSFDVAFPQGMASAVNLIEKPFAADSLLRRVRAVLDEDEDGDGT